MAETTDTVKIVLRVIGEDTEALRQTRRALDDNAAAATRAGNGQRALNAAAVDGDRQTRRLANALDRVTSTSGLAATAVSRMGSMMVNLPMQAVAIAVGVLTAALITQVVKWLDLESSANRAKKVIDSLGQSSIMAARVAIPAIQTEIETLKKLLDLGSASAPFIAMWRESMGNPTGTMNDAALKERIRDLERLRDTILGPKPTEQEIGFGENQEAMGRRIQQQAKLEFEARGAAQEEQGRWIQQQAKLEFEARGATQEERGRQIAEAAQRELADAGAHQEALGQQIQDAARYELAVRQQTADMAIAIEQVKNQGMLAVASTLLSAAAGKSKAIFALSKALGVAQIVVATNVAAAEALAHPPGPPTTIPLAASVKAWGYALAAATGAVGLAQTFAAGGGSPGGAGGSTSVPATAREIGPSASAQPLPQTINIYIDGNLVDLSQLSRELRPYQIQLTKDTI